MPNVFKNSISGSVGTAGSVVYTTPISTSTTVIGMSVANVHPSNNISVTANLTSGSWTVSIVKNATVPVGGTTVLIGGDQKMVLTANNFLSVTSSVGASADVIVSVLEIS